MKFSKIIGKVDDKLVAAAEKKLSEVFLELGIRYDNEHVGSGLGGDPLIFGLMYPVEHICTLNMPTAATDGKRYYWNPKFVVKQSRIGLRIICGHEAWHALYMHPQRRGSRLPKLWNIAVDYIVNGTVMEDFKARKKNPGEMFSKHLGKYMTLTQYAEMLKDPFAKTKGFEEIDPLDKSNEPDKNVPLPNPMDDRELTPEEQKELEKKEKREKFYYADPDLEEDMKSPEKIYDMLYQLLPKCPKCGSIGMYKLPKKNKGKKDKGDKGEPGDKGEKGDHGDKHEHGDGEKCDCPDHQGDKGEPGDKDGQGDSCGDGDEEGCCGGCGDGVDIFGLGGTVDDHLDTQETQEKLAKRISDAMETAKKMAGHVPAALEGELGKLTAPVVRWQDIIRTRLMKARAGNGRNDYTRFKSRPMFAGVLTPKKRSYTARFGCLLDSSGSMSNDDCAFGLSQLAALDERSEGIVTNCDATCYWDKSTTIKKANIEELSKVKRTGYGGTLFAPYFTDYEEHIGKCDFLVIVSDGYLDTVDVANMVNPGIPVYWLLTANSGFTPPFGRAFDLRQM